MASRVAIYDACVLYPAPLRDLLLRLALTDQVRARWTDRIHEEWMAAIRRQRPDLPATALQRTRALMERAVPEARVTGYEALIDPLALPDPDDRHVLAAAIHARADTIVTFNLKDFPAAVLAAHGIEAQHPDDFVCQLHELAPAAVYAAVRQQREALQHPPKSAQELLDTLRSLGLVRTVAALEPLRALL